MMISAMRNMDSRLDLLLLHAVDSNVHFGSVDKGNMFTFGEMIKLFQSLFLPCLEKSNVIMNGLSANSSAVEDGVLIRYRVHFGGVRDRFFVELFEVRSFHQPLWVRLVDNIAGNHKKEMPLEPLKSYFQRGVESTLLYFFSDIKGWVNFSENFNVWWGEARVRCVKNNENFPAVSDLRIGTSATQLGSGELDKYEFDLNGKSGLFILLKYNESKNTLNAELNRGMDTFRRFIIENNDADSDPVSVLVGLLECACSWI